MMLERGRRPHPPQPTQLSQRAIPAQRAINKKGQVPRRRCCTITRAWVVSAGLLVSSYALLWLGYFRNPFRGGSGKVKKAEERPKMPVITFGTMGTSHSVRDHGAGPSGVNDTENIGARPGSMVTPEQWDSSLCMEHWGRKELQTEVDPNGYVVFVSGAEQLGGNKYLLTDGLFVAKILDRTLVEYPAKDARISGANTTMGLGAYWDLSAMCMNHRMIDLRAFRGLVDRGLISAEDFVTIETGQQQVVTRHFKNAPVVRKFYEDKTRYKVIVMEHTWKSQLKRRTMAYLQPNPFFYGVVRMLMVDHEDFANGNFLAVQWRTETATGDMAQCYEEVRALIEEKRRLLGLTRDQVLICTDMYGSTSGTYGANKQSRVGAETIQRINQDYPKALNNRLHDFFDRIEDTGIKAIVSGLVIAHARMLLASSLNNPATKDSPEAAVCQKPFSGYIQLIVEWRTNIYRRSPDTVVRLFPFGDTVVSNRAATSTDTDSGVEHDGEGTAENQDKEGAQRDGQGAGVTAQV